MAYRQGWHGRPRKVRIFAYMPYGAKRRQRLRLVCFGLLLAVMLVSAAQLAGYWRDAANARRASEELRALYYAEATATATQQPAATPAMTDAPSAPLPVQEEAQTAAPSATPGMLLIQSAYPNNPYRVISSRFKKLRQQNADIIGWLTIDGMVDEAVVQRDNDYYLTRDYRGYHNVNGAIFLDEACDLSFRPATMTLYGHNMKTGAMFGRLHKYESLSYYREHALITFDTMYEDGRYAVFAAGKISLNSWERQYVPLSMLYSTDPQRRARAIDSLRAISAFVTAVDVQAEDQLLLLITCVEDADERWLVAARRVREGESEETLAYQARQCSKNPAY